MTPAPYRPGGHLFPALLACVLAGALVASGYAYARGLERRYIHALAADFSEAKLQGVALQREAFRQNDLLVLYGSSELQKPMPNNATEFFADYRTGFGVFPVGKPGATSLALLQRVAGVGDEARGRKVAFSLSPGWFFTESFPPSYYEGNFSQLQATELVFSGELSHGLKRDIARRMLEFPRTLEEHDLLEFALQRLAGDTWSDRLLYALLWPAGQLEVAIADGQDHLETALHILLPDEALNWQATKGERLNSQRVKWAEVLKKAARFTNKDAIQKKRNEVARRRILRGSRDQAFQQTIARAKEWTDLELLLRMLKELGSQPLLLSMPVEDIRLEVYGITSESRTAYLERMKALAYYYGFQLRDFQDYEHDPTFLVDFQDHLSGSGWLYYNKALDEFFHGNPGNP